MLSSGSECVQKLRNEYLGFGKITRGVAGKSWTATNYEDRFSSDDDDGGIISVYFFWLFVSSECESM